jgi:hypothetical protein
VLEFQSDSAGHQRGFSIRATQILCSELGNGKYVCVRFTVFKPALRCEVHPYVRVNVFPWMGVKLAPMSEDPLFYPSVFLIKQCSPLGMNPKDQSQPPRAKGHPYL